MGFRSNGAWAESHPERFELLYGGRENDPWFRLYRITATRSRVKGGAGVSAILRQNLNHSHGFDDSRALIIETGGT